MVTPPDCPIGPLLQKNDEENATRGQSHLCLSHTGLLFVPQHLDMTSLTKLVVFQPSLPADTRDHAKLMHTAVRTGREEEETKSVYHSANEYALGYRGVLLEEWYTFSSNEQVSYIG